MRSEFAEMIFNFENICSTPLHYDRLKLQRVLAVLSATGLECSIGGVSQK